MKTLDDAISVVEHPPHERRIKTKYIQLVRCVSVTTAGLDNDHSSRLGLEPFHVGWCG
jgi:hypothetical protein